ncbi:MAG: DNA-binding protein [Phycisphaera sp.]|nr:MAG: DNA-binding protein [Phycisphaera sp.]
MVGMQSMPLALTEEDIRQAEKSGRKLSRFVEDDKPLRITPAGADAETVEIPAVAAQLLVRILSEMAQGNAVTLIPIDAVLTTQRAADLLGVSRPFVVKEIEEDRLPAKKIGSHRRILAKDLMEYMRRQDAERQIALDELARLDQEMGL